jgi:hypothetical protein
MDNNPRRYGWRGQLDTIGLREECEKAGVRLKCTILPRHLYVLEKRIVSANKIVGVMTHQGVERRFD